MRHNLKKLQLNRFTSWRRATLKSMAKSLLRQQSIQTTKTKALAVKPLIEKIITLGRTNSLAAKRKAFTILGDHGLVSLLFSDIAPRFNHKAGGYTRIIHLRRRRGDNAQLVILELTEIKKKEVPRPKEAKAEVAIEQEKPQAVTKQEKPVEPKRPKKETAVALEEKAAVKKKPEKKFLGGLRKIFKKERDSL